MHVCWSKALFLSFNSRGTATWTTFDRQARKTLPRVVGESTTCDIRDLANYIKRFDFGAFRFLISFSWFQWQVQVTYRPSPGGSQSRSALRWRMHSHNHQIQHPRRFMLWPMSWTKKSWLVLKKIGCVCQSYPDLLYLEVDCVIWRSKFRHLSSPLCLFSESPDVVQEKTRKTQRREAS